jgi:hypothetical protein
MTQVVVSVTVPTSVSADTGRTFVQLQDAVLAHGFSERYRAQAQSWLNTALGRMARSAHQYGTELETTIPVAVGIQLYTLPGTAMSVMDVRDTYGNHLEDVGREVVDEYPVDVGPPAVFTIFHSRLHIAPSPDKATTLYVRYRGVPAQMTSDAATSGLPYAYDDLLVHYALWMAYLEEDDADMATVHKQAWNEGLQEFKREVTLLDETRSGQVQGMMGSDPTPRFRRP